MTRDELLEQLGTASTNRPSDRLRRFAHLPEGSLQTLAKDALSENWDSENHALVKYLAITIGWAIDSGDFDVSGDQLTVAAGHLQTRYGTPLYLAFKGNRNAGKQPWALVAAGSRVVAARRPSPPPIPAPPVLPKGAEIVMLHEHILGDNADRVTFLRDTPQVAQMCAVSGAIQWSINRGLHIPYWYYGKMSYVVPLYLSSREDITQAPDLVAPIEVSADTLLVRTVLLPNMPYPNARPAAHRHDQLPSWMISAWNSHVATVSQNSIEEVEPSATT